tara:strand:+ start:5807 stop:6142 length:336 start_codon:yes stop_codon:yes gene_type:complete
MKKIILIGLCLLFLLGNKSTTAIQHEATKPLSDIMLYCNTLDFIRNMAKNDYMLGLAASGIVNDDKHRMLLSMELLMNRHNKQWAVIFNYKKGNLSCIIGGNHIRLFSPKT